MGEGESGSLAIAASAKALRQKPAGRFKEQKAGSVAGA